MFDGTMYASGDKIIIRHCLGAMTCMGDNQYDHLESYGYVIDINMRNDKFLSVIWIWDQLLSVNWIFSIDLTECYCQYQQIDSDTENIEFECLDICYHDI